MQNPLMPNLKQALSFCIFATLFSGLGCMNPFLAPVCGPKGQSNPTMLRNMKNKRAQQRSFKPRMLDDEEILEWDNQYLAERLPLNYLNYSEPQETDEIEIQQIRKAYNDTVFKVIPASADRFSAHLQTDKVVYRPGDVMFVQAYVFEALNKTPAYSQNLKIYSTSFFTSRSFPQSYSEPYVYLTMTIINPIGDAVYTSGAYMRNSTVSWTYIIPDEAPSGEYQIRASGSNIPEQVRVVRVREYKREELSIQIVFAQTAYKPGDFVNGTLVIRPTAALSSNNFTQQNAPSFTVLIDFGNGQRFTQALTQTDSSGAAQINFQVPQNYSLDYLAVGVTVFYLQIIQGYSQTLTIVQPENLYIRFYPETFNYVFDVENRVYFQVFSSNETATADFVNLQNASLVQESVPEVVNNDSSVSSRINITVLQENISTLNQGRGVFTFTPRSGYKYYLQLTQNNESYSYDLLVNQQPDIENLELNFAAADKVIESDQNVRVIVRTNSKVRDYWVYVVGIFNKERILSLQEYRFSPSSSYLINIQNDNINLTNGGVLRVAIFRVINPLIWYDRYDKNAKNQSTYNLLPNPFYEVYFLPKGEILFFKKPSAHLIVDLWSSPSNTFKPGEQVTITARVRDFETGQAVGYNRANPSLRSFVSLTVTDDSVFYQIPQSQQPPSLPTMVYLEDEVQRRDNQLPNAYSYIDYIYQQREAASNQSANQQSDSYYLQPTFSPRAPSQNSSDINLALLLGVQGWRYGYFYPQVLEEWPGLIDSLNASERRQLQQLMAYTFSGGQRYYSVRTAAKAAGGAFAASPSVVAFRASAVSEDQGELESAPTTEETTPEEGAPSQQRGQQASTAGTSLSSRELELYNFLKQYIRCTFETNARYYSHRNFFSVFSSESSRLDTMETLLYQASQMTDKNGEYSTTFETSDLMASFRVTATAFDTTGRMGYSQSLILNRKDFFINFELPVQMAVGDSLLIPVYIYNFFNTNVNVTLQSNAFQNQVRAVFEKGNNSTNAFLQVSAQNQSVIYLRVTALNISDTVNIQIKATTVSPFTNEIVSDSLIQDTSIISPGVPQSQSESGLIGPDQPAEFLVNLPGSMVAHTQQLVAEIYPTSAQAILQILIALITSSPGPCFICIYNPLLASLFLVRASDLGQTALGSNINSYRTQAGVLGTLIKGYLSSDESSASEFQNGQRDPFLSALYLISTNQAQSYLGLQSGNDYNRVVQRLINLVQSNANNSIHESYPSGQVSSGRLFYSSYYSDYVVEAFIIYALTSINNSPEFVSRLRPEIRKLEDFSNQQKNSRGADTLLIGLLSNIYININSTAQANANLDFLATQQLTDGSIHQVITADQQDINRLLFKQFDATAAATLGWLRSNQSEVYTQNSNRGIIYLINNIRYRYYGSPIGLVMGLEAILLYLGNIQGIQGSGEFVLRVNNKEIDVQEFSSQDQLGVIDFDTTEIKNSQDFAPGQSVQITIQVENYQPNEKVDQETQESTIVEGLAQSLNKKQVSFHSQIHFSESFSVPYFIEVTYDDTQPQNSQLTSLNLSVLPLFDVSTLGSAQNQAQLLSYNFSIANLNQNASLGLIVLEIRPSACLTVNFAELENLRVNGAINQYQALDNNSLLQLYFEGLAPGESQSITLSFLQRYQGQCQQRPADAFQYYDPSQKVFAFF